MVDEDNGLEITAIGKTLSNLIFSNLIFSALLNALSIASLDVSPE